VFAKKWFHNSDVQEALLEGLVARRVEDRCERSDRWWLVSTDDKGQGVDSLLFPYDQWKRQFVGFGDLAGIDARRVVDSLKDVVLSGNLALPPSETEARLRWVKEHVWGKVHPRLLRLIIDRRQLDLDLDSRRIIPVPSCLDTSEEIHSVGFPDHDTGSYDARILWNIGFDPWNVASLASSLVIRTISDPCDGTRRQGIVLRRHGRIIDSLGFAKVYYRPRITFDSLPGIPVAARADSIRTNFQGSSRRGNDDDSRSLWLQQNLWHQGERRLVALHVEDRGNIVWLDLDKDRLTVKDPR
jgi:hypothetical protein